MKVKITILVILFLLLTPILSTNQLGETLAAKDNKIYQLEDAISAKKFDKEAKILADYLAQFNSPLQYHAQDFIEAARVYNLDWKMLPAIAGVESTFGKFTPGGYNGWGWGVYGTQAIYFKSWKQAIFTVASGLRENYLNKGLTEPYSINRVYAASPYWGSNVTYFMNDLKLFAAKQKKDKEHLAISQQSPSIAAVSAELVLR